MNNNKMKYVFGGFKIIIFHISLAFSLSAFHTTMKCIDIQNNNGHIIVTVPAKGKSVKAEKRKKIVELVLSSFLEKYISLWNESNGYALTGRLLSDLEIKKIAIVLMNDETAKKLVSDLIFPCSFTATDEKFHADFRWYLKWLIMPAFMFRSFYSIICSATVTFLQFDKDLSYMDAGWNILVDGLWHYCFDVLPLSCFFKYLKKTRNDGLNKKLEEKLNKKISAMAVLINSHKQ